MNKLLKVCNLYCGIGGNRKLWEDVEVTAIENNPDIAKIYQDFFPEDTVIVTDAHQYLLEYFKEYDFIWSSPPCPTHSVCNNFLHVQGNIRYPDMALWQEIIFLNKWFKGKFCVENVISYYKPLIPCVELDRHYFWINFNIRPFDTKKNFNIARARASTRGNVEKYKGNLEQYHGFDLKNIPNKIKYLRNCVHSPLGLHILNESKSNIQQTLFQTMGINK